MSGKFRVPFIFLAVVLILSSGTFCWWAIKKKTVAVDKETTTIVKTNKGLEQTLAELEELYANFEQYLTDTREYKDKSNKILQYFPTFMYIEDKVLYVDSIIKSSFSNYGFTREGYSENDLILSVSYTGGLNMLNIYESEDDAEKKDEDQEDELEEPTTDEKQEKGELLEPEVEFDVERTEITDDGTTTLSLYRVTINMDYSGINYKMVKHFLDYGSVVDVDELLKYSKFDEKTGQIIKFYTESGQRFVVNNMTVGFDNNTGLLAGNVSFHTYFVSGPDNIRHYEFPQEVINDLGDSNRIDDLFGLGSDGYVHVTENEKNQVEQTTTEAGEE